MKLHLPKALFAAVVAALTCVQQADAATYYLNAVAGNGVNISASFKTESGGNTSVAWQKFCSGQGAYDGPHQLVIDQERTVNNKVKIDFAPFNVTGFTVTAAGNHLYREKTKDSIIIGDGADGAGDQSSSFSESFTLELQGNNGGVIKLVGTQSWTIDSGKNVNLIGTVTNSGSWTVSGGNVSITNGINNTGSLDISNGGVTISSTINNTGGTITTSTNTVFNITDISSLSSRINDNYASEENAIIQLKKDYLVIDGGSVSGNAQVSYTANETTSSTTLTDGKYFSLADREAYGIVKDSTLSDIQDGVNQGGATLIAVKQGITLSKGEGAEFTTAQKLTGNGTFDLGKVSNGSNTVLVSNLTLDELWRGTVSLSGGEFTENTSNNDKSIKDINFNNLGHTGSTVEIAKDGLYGYLNDGPNANTGVTYTPDILLTGNLTLQNGNSNSASDRSYTHTFTGKIKGIGDLNISRTGGDEGSLTFTNDISEWSGTLRHTDNNGNAGDLSTTVKLQGNATVVNAAILREGGYLNLVVNNTSNATTFNENVKVSKLTATGMTLGESVTLTLTGAKDNSASSITSLTTHSTGNTITLESGATLNRIDNVTGTVKLEGTGKYNLGALGNTSTPYGSNVSFTNFTGTFTATSGHRSLNINDFNSKDINESAKLQLSGLTGRLGSGNTLKTNLILENSTDGYALRLDNGISTSNETATFAGSVEGTGNMLYSWDVGSTAKTTHVFAGDTSNWKGKFVRELRDCDNNGIGEGKATEVKFTKGGNVFHTSGTGGVEDMATTSKTTVIIESAEATTFNGSLVNIKALDVKTNTTFKQSVNSSKLTVNSVADFEKGFNVTELVMSSGSEVSSATTVSGMSSIQILGAATLDSNLDLTNTSTLQLDGTLNLVDNALTLDSLTLNGSKLTEILALTEGGRVNLFSGVSTLILGGSSYQTGALTEDNGLAFGDCFSYTATMSATSGGDIYLGFDANGMVYAGMRNIPEPTTATLSLLALAALAARRRRK